MNHFDEQPSWSDQDVDRLLTQFFDAEMPAAIRELPTDAAPSISAPRVIAPAAAVNQSASTGPQQVAGASSASNRAAWAGVATAAAVLLMAAVFAPGFRDADGSGVIQVAENPAITAPVELDRDEISVERFDLEDGAVEQRTNLRWKNVAANDPAAGTQSEWIMPELEIEFYDVDEADESPSVRG